MEDKRFLMLMCNFLNNTGGYIDKESVIWLVCFLAPSLDYDDVKSKISDEDVKLLSDEVECDNKENFYTRVIDLTIRIKRVILENTLHEIQKHISYHHYVMIKELIDKEIENIEV